MGSTLIVKCSNCGGLLLAKIEQKTRTCPHCQKKVVVERARKVASAQNAYQASELLRNIKRDAALKDRSG